MSATTKSSKRIKGLAALPVLPELPKSKRRQEAKEAAAFIRSIGGKPMSAATRKRLEKAGCYGMPEE